MINWIFARFLVIIAVSGVGTWKTGTIANLYIRIWTIHNEIPIVPWLGSIHMHLNPLVKLVKPNVGLHWFVGDYTYATEPRHSGLGLPR
jgi:hypothetical protein